MIKVGIEGQTTDKEKKQFLKEWIAQVENEAISRDIDMSTFWKKPQAWKIDSRDQ
jgi:hypothetical protein